MADGTKKDKETNDYSGEQWGAVPDGNLGYKDDAERHDKRGLEDWEMLQHMEESSTSIPYWFVAIFILLLLVAVGLTFPFFGNRPGFERPWFDWGIPAGVAWVIVMSAVIYYFVDLRHVLREKREAKKAAKVEQENNSSQDKN